MVFLLVKTITQKNKTMGSIFGKSKEEENKKLPEWIAEMKEIEERWKAFVQKMQQRVNELGEAAIPELEQAFKDDAENDTNNYHRIRSGIAGQIRGMKDKANDVYEEKVNNFYIDYKEDTPHSNPARELLDDFRTNNHDLLNEFEQSCDKWIDKAEATEVENPEEKYQNILDTYEGLKEKFKCSQCGGKIKIERIYFISTYLHCGHCQTQNTFDPGTTIKELEWVTRSLAEARTKHILDASVNADEQERELYSKIHNLSLDSKFENNAAKKANMLAQMEELETQRKKCKSEAPELYKKYLRAMFDEWHRLMPDMKEQNERVYEGMLKNYKRGF
jgi:RNA polymerase-binding transcription factor DksA